MITSFRYHNTNCFFIENKTNDELLAVDAGWPCSLFEYKRNLKQIDLDFESIKYAIVTHFHMDHAGLIGEFIKLGIRCLVLDLQVSAIDEMERIIKKNTEYKEYINIEKENLIISSPKIVNNYLALHNFDVYTESLNSHSDDHIGVFVGQGEVIIGDLAPINQIMNDDQKANENWERIIAKGVKVAYPSHADVITL